uniref:Major sperm protein n=1 Tax=Panagrellus redivivus TaxID=6233 RepID=A0A7E4UYR8_PANRE
MASGGPTPLQTMRPRRRLTDVSMRRVSDSTTSIVRSAPNKSAPPPYPNTIEIEPSTKIAFNAPFRVSHVYHLSITNTTSWRISWMVKTTNQTRLSVIPSCGILDPKENIMCGVSCNSFKSGTNEPVDDRVIIEWMNTPKGATKTFHRELFEQGEVLIRRKNLPVEYNP